MSLRQAINQKCRECIYDDSPGSGGTWRQQVEACTSQSCPLYAVRPRPVPSDKPKRGDFSGSGGVGAQIQGVAAL